MWCAEFEPIECNGATRKLTRASLILRGVLAEPEEDVICVQQQQEQQDQTLAKLPVVGEPLPYCRNPPFLLSHSRRSMSSVCPAFTECRTM